MVPNPSTFLALTAQGTVVVWGSSQYGGTIPDGSQATCDEIKRWTPCQEEELVDVKSELIGVRTVFPLGLGYLALMWSGNVVAWPCLRDFPSNFACISEPIKSKMQSIGIVWVTRTLLTAKAGAVVFRDGSLIAFGREQSGGKIPADVAEKLTRVRTVQANAQAFAAFVDDGKLVIWGGSGQWASKYDNGVIPPDGTEADCTTHGRCMYATCRCSCGATCAELASTSQSLNIKEMLQNSSIRTLYTRRVNDDSQTWARGYFLALTTDRRLIAWGGPYNVPPYQDVRVPSYIDDDGNEIDSDRQPIWRSKKLHELEDVRSVVIHEKATVVVMMDDTVIAFGDQNYGGKIWDGYTTSELYSVNPSSINVQWYLKNYFMSAKERTPCPPGEGVNSIHACGKCPMGKSTPTPVLKREQVCASYLGQNADTLFWHNAIKTLVTSPNDYDDSISNSRGATWCCMDADGVTPVAFVDKWYSSGQGWITGYQCPSNILVRQNFIGDEYWDMKLCVECPTGYKTERPGTMECHKCKAGQYDPPGAKLADPCRTCDAGFYQSELGQDKCYACPNNTFLGYDNTAPREAHDSLEDCIPCPTNQHTNGTEGASTCMSCTAGRYTKLGDSEPCVDCPRGWMQPRAGKGSCVACPRGEFQFDVGKSFCLPCPPGNYNHQTQQSGCQDCEKDTYTDSVRQHQCKTCVIGKFTKESRSSSCQSCPAGYAGTPCTICPAGKARGNDEDPLSCNACSKGTYQDQKAKASCMTCITGTFAATENQVSCQDCDFQYFADVVGSSTCSECPSGYEAVDKGSTRCNKCRAGKRGEQNKSGCLNCGRGRFQQASNAISIACRSCPTGYSQNKTSQGACLPCIPGRFQSEEGHATCLVCLKNTFAGISSQTRCTDCVSGQFTISMGSASCIGCEAGQYGDGCMKCAEGRYRGGKAAMDVTDRCTTCPVGFAQSVLGSSACLVCVPGKYQNEEARAACNQCPVGYYSSLQDSEKWTKCVRCQKGAYQSELGKASCLSCVPGEYQDEEAKIACKQCPIGYYSSLQDSQKWTTCARCPSGTESTNEGSSMCTSCDLGKFYNAMGDGICSSCQSGHYQDARGKLSCVPCPADTYLTQSGSTALGACQKCSVNYAEHTTTNGITGVASPALGCVCAGAQLDASDAVSQRGYYTNPDVNPDVNEENKLCLPCPMGADCQSDGTTLQSMSSKPGFWRSHSTGVTFADCARGLPGLESESIAKERCCPILSDGNISSCANKTFAHPDAQCLSGYGGPLCTSCALNYVKINATHCQYCKGGSSVMATTLVMSVLVGIFFLLIVVKYMRAGRKSKIKTDEEKDKQDKKKKTMKKHESNSQDAVGRFVGDQSMIGRLEGSSSNKDDIAATGNNSSMSRNEFQVVCDRIKVIYSWLQIFTALHITFEAPWPASLKSMTISLSAINLDFGDLFATSSCQYALPFLDKFVMHMCLPVVLVIATCLGRAPAHFLRRKKEQRRKQHEFMMKTVITLLLIMYPGICVRCFLVLKCVQVDGLAGTNGHSGVVLMSDYSVECWQDHHNLYATISFVCIGLFVVGIPLGVLTTLWYHKRHLYDVKSPRHKEVVHEFGTLYLQYEPNFWYWEVIVIFKKMILTGVMCVVGAGSSAQLVIALLVVLVYMQLVLKLAPFVDNTDDWLSFMTSFQLLITLLGGLLLFTDDPDPAQKTYDSEIMGVVLIGVNLIAFVALLVSLVLLCPCIRRRCEKKVVVTQTKVVLLLKNVRPSKNNNSNSPTKVFPVTNDLPGKKKAVMTQSDVDDFKNWGK